MGMIPNMKKTNQDTHLVVKDLAGCKGLWMFGVMDGHGANGHHVSELVRKNLPNFLASIIQGSQCIDSLNSKKSIASAKLSLKKSLP